MAKQTYASSGKECLRDLSNYKSMHEQKAKAQGCHAEFMMARTLTAARKILFGEKVKNFKARRDVKDAK